ncbi:MAG: hypothetical protein VKK99_07075 [Cyanobacteriota bacterium]|nr:hypothetical protein [Cyanobacteriota bacterium]
MPRFLSHGTSTALVLAMALGWETLASPASAQVRPIRGGVGGPASGAGVAPGAGFGRPGLAR